MKRNYALTLPEFITLRYQDELEPERVYEVTNSRGDTHFGWSPDGVGAFWYDTLAELDAEHGVTL